MRWSRRWSLRESLLPGVDISAPGSVSVSDTAELVWTFACGQTPQVTGNRAESYDRLINLKMLNWIFSPEQRSDRQRRAFASSLAHPVAFGSSLETAGKLGSIALKDARQCGRASRSSRKARARHPMSPPWAGVGHSPLAAMRTMRFKVQALNQSGRRRALLRSAMAWGHALRRVGGWAAVAIRRDGPGAVVA